MISTSFYKGEENFACSEKNKEASTRHLRWGSIMAIPWQPMMNCDI